jgi:hypothetical protein
MEELPQGEQLPAIAQPRLGQQSDFGQRVNDHAARLHTPDRVHDLLACLGQFHLGGVEHRVLAFRREDFRRGQDLLNLDRGRVPAVRPSGLFQFLFRFRK